MKIIKVECAGSGKTYGIANSISEEYSTGNNSKKIIAITHTNNAVFQIKNEVIKQIGFIPENVIVETTDTFLLHNVIYPYSKYILSNNYISCSICQLPSDIKFANFIKSVMKSENTLHSSEINSKVKAILVPKKSDSKLLKKKKEIVRELFFSSIKSIYIDEIQDLDENGFEILDFLFTSDVNLYCVGDFRQALRYPKTFYDYINNCSNEKWSIENKTESRRVPISNLNLTNKLFEKKYECTNCNNTIGMITYSYADESIIDKYIKYFDLTYIKEKNDIFLTSAKKDNSFFTRNEREFISQNFQGDSDIFISAFISEYKTLLSKGLTNKAALNVLQRKYNLPNFDRTLYAKLCNINNEIEQMDNNVVVKSIESIKGLEADKCMFIINNSLMNILLGNNSFNKETNLLYVALTRSKEHLHILVLKECIEKYSKEIIDNFMRENNIDVFEIK